MKFWLFLLGFPALLSGEMIWQADIQKPFAITIQLNSQQIPLDGLLDLEADFQYPSSYQLSVNSLLDKLTWSANPLFPKLSLYQSTIESIPTKEGLQIQRLHATLSPLVAGPLEISFLTITFLPKEKSQSPLPVLTPIFTLQVTPLSGQIPPLPTAPVIPLQPQFPLGLTEANRELLIDNPARIEEEKRRIQVTLDSHTFPWLTVLALLGCGGIGWTAYLTRERWYKRPSKPISTISPQQKVNQSLQNLQKGHLLEQGLIQTYYSELSSILMDALHSRASKLTSKLTTAELAHRLKDEHNLSSNQKRDVLSFLAEIDQVKFAGETPSLEHAKQMYHKIEGFIQQLYS
jgi:hypothetical protein